MGGHILIQAIALLRQCCAPDVGRRLAVNWAKNMKGGNERARYETAGGEGTQTSKQTDAGKTKRNSLAKTAGRGKGQHTRDKRDDCIVDKRIVAPGSAPLPTKSASTGATRSSTPRKKKRTEQSALKSLRPAPSLRANSTRFGRHSPPSSGIAAHKLMGGSNEFGQSERTRADAQTIVTTRLLCVLHDPVRHPSRLQGLHPDAR